MGLKREEKEENAEDNIRTRVKMWLPGFCSLLLPKDGKDHKKGKHNKSVTPIMGG